MATRALDSRARWRDTGQDATGEGAPRRRREVEGLCKRDKSDPQSRQFPRSRGLNVPAVFLG